MGLIYLTFQKTNGQGATPEGQPDQLHIGPFVHVQWYGGGLEAEVREGHGDEMPVSKLVYPIGAGGYGYATQQIVADDFSKLSPYDGMFFGSVIIHDGGLLEEDAVVIDVSGVSDRNDYDSENFDVSKMEPGFTVPHFGNLLYSRLPEGAVFAAFGPNDNDEFNEYVYDPYFELSTAPGFEAWFVKRESHIWLRVVKG